MRAPPREIVTAETQSFQNGDVLRSHKCELIEQGADRPALVFPEHGATVEGHESFGLTVIQNHPRPWNPVGQFAMNEMSDNVVSAPGAGAFGALHPALGHTANHGCERRRGLPQNLRGFRKFQLHVRSSNGFRFGRKDQPGFDGIYATAGRKVPSRGLPWLRADGRKLRAKLVGTGRFEREPFCGRERSGSPQAKSRTRWDRTKFDWSGRADLNCRPL